MTDSRETVWRKRQQLKAGRPTHCTHPVATPVKGICAAYAKAGSPYPHVCDKHYKEES